MLGVLLIAGRYGGARGCFPRISVLGLIVWLLVDSFVIFDSLMILVVSERFPAVIDSVWGWYNIRCVGWQVSGWALWALVLLDLMVVILAVGLGVLMSVYLIWCFAGLWGVVYALVIFGFEWVGGCDFYVWFDWLQGGVLLDLVIPWRL